MSVYTFNTVASQFQKLDGQVLQGYITAEQLRKDEQVAELTEQIAELTEQMKKLQAELVTQSTGTQLSLQLGRNNEILLEQVKNLEEQVKKLQEQREDDTLALHVARQSQVSELEREKLILQEQVRKLQEEKMKQQHDMNRLEEAQHAEQSAKEQVQELERKNRMLQERIKELQDEKNRLLQEQILQKQQKAETHITGFLPYIRGPSLMNAEVNRLPQEEVKGLLDEDMTITSA